MKLATLPWLVLHFVFHYRTHLAKDSYDTPSCNLTSKVVRAIRWPSLAGLDTFFWSGEESYFVITTGFHFCLIIIGNSEGRVALRLGIDWKMFHQNSVES